jgi:hypothetical protein
MLTDMQTSFSGAATVWNSELNEFISEDHRRLAEVLHDYHPGRYSLVFIPIKDRVTAEEIAKPFAILENRHGGATIVRYLSEAEMRDPAGVIAWVYAGDLAKHRPNDVLAQIEAREAAEKLINFKRQEDAIEERIEMTAFLVSGGREKKHSVRLGKGKSYERV